MVDLKRPCLPRFVTILTILLILSWNPSSELSCLKGRNQIYSHQNDPFTLVGYLNACCTCVFHLSQANPPVTTHSLTHGSLNDWPAKSKTKLSPWANPELVAVLAVWSLREPNLPWSTVEPNSMSKGIQPVLNHHSKKKKKRRGGGEIQLCLSILWTASELQHPKLKPPRTHACSLRRTLNHVHSFPHARIQTHFLNTLAHALITHAFPLPTVTGKQCPPLPSQCTPPLPSAHFTSPPTSSAPLPFFFVVGAVIEEFLPC